MKKIDLRKQMEKRKNGPGLFLRKIRLGPFLRKFRPGPNLRFWAKKSGFY